MANKFKDIERENVIEETPYVMETVSLEEVIETCKNFTTGVITPEELTTWSAKISIKSYISLYDKMALLFAIVFTESYLNTESTELRVMEFENKKFWNVLLAYTNIDVSNKELCNFDNYDLCFPIMADWILGYCEKDYNRLIQMVNDNINLMNVIKLSEAMESIDNTQITENTNKINELLTSIQDNKDLANDLATIVKFNDPKTTRIIDTIEKEALNIMNEKD